MRYLSYGIFNIHRKLTSGYLVCDKASLTLAGTFEGTVIRFKTTSVSFKRKIKKPHYSKTFECSFFVKEKTIKNSIRTEQSEKGKKKNKKQKKKTKNKGKKK
jgi:hypothetical protein